MAGYLLDPADKLTPKKHTKITTIVTQTKAPTFTSKKTEADEEDMPDMPDMPDMRSLLKFRTDNRAPLTSPAKRSYSRKCGGICC